VLDSQVMYRLKVLKEQNEDALPKQKGRIIQDRQCVHERDIEARSRNHCCRGKQ
jgi:hypothetical protein